MAAKLKHLAISSSNASLLLDFYSSLFGMQHESGQAATDGYLGLNVNRRGKGRQAGIDHFGIEVDDVQAIMARCRERYPRINFLKRPDNRPFASIGTHDPAGNVFDLTQAGMENRKGVYAESSDDWQPRHVSHFELRAVQPELLADFYQDIYGLSLEAGSGSDRRFALSDGRVTLVLSQWDIRDYDGTGVERPAIEHIGFGVESMNAFKSDLDQLMESRPELFPAFNKSETEGARRMELLATCSRGELRLNDPDGCLLDVGPA
jgi:predicted enzyme related to lactoylglutathione lyase